VRLRPGGSCFVPSAAVRWGRAPSGLFKRPWNRVAVKGNLFRWGCFVVPACSVLPASGALPDVDLTGRFALLAYVVSASGSLLGIPWLALLMTGLLVGRPGVPKQRRAAEASVLLAALLLVLAGGACLNEHFIKPALAVARPDIIELADAGALGMTIEEFYALEDKPSRSGHLRKVLEAEGLDAVALHPWIREHWIAETGFSFPSGHSFAAMTFATFFLAMGLVHLEGPRLAPFYLLLPWAVMVCCSRTILRVHSATDVTCGALLGVVVGVTTFVVVRGVGWASPTEKFCAVGDNTLYAVGDNKR